MSGDERVGEEADTEAQSGVAERDDPKLGTDESWLQVAQTYYEPAGDRELTTAIVTAIADAEGVDPMKLGPPLLYDVVDVPAIEQSFFGSRTGNRTRNATGATQFRYGRYLVKVRSDGWIEVFE